MVSALIIVCYKLGKANNIKFNVDIRDNLNLNLFVENCNVHLRPLNMLKYVGKKGVVIFIFNLHLYHSTTILQSTFIIASHFDIISNGFH